MDIDFYKKTKSNFHSFFQKIKDFWILQKKIDVSLKSQIEKIDSEFHREIFVFHFFTYCILLIPPFSNSQLSVLDFFWVGLFIFLGLKLKVNPRIRQIIIDATGCFIAVYFIILFSTQLQKESPEIVREGMNFLSAGFFFMIFLHSFRMRLYSCILVGVYSFLSYFFILGRYPYEGSGVFLVQFSFLSLVASVIGTYFILKKRQNLYEMFLLTREKNEIQNDLRLAEKVQDTLIPSKLNIAPLLYTTYRKNIHSIGGDFFEIIKLREGNLGVFIADVAGHGVSSALVASAIKVMAATIPYEYKHNP